VHDGAYCSLTLAGTVGMSGHSKWSTIKHQKEAQDKKRGVVFSKLARLIAIAARDGEDPDKNSRLRMEIEKARKFNMPKENITRAVERGSGKGGGEALESFVYEAYGPSGIALIIEGITDNKNRTISEVKNILTKHQGKMGGEGSVSWMFSHSGVINTSLPENKELIESLTLEVINAGAEDIVEKEDGLNIVVPIEKLEEIKKLLLDSGIEIQSASVEWVPKNPVAVSEQDRNVLERLFEALDEHDDIQEIYSNTKN